MGVTGAFETQQQGCGDASLSVPGSNRTAAGKRRLGSSGVAAAELASFVGFAAVLQRVVGMRWKGSDSF